MFSAHTESAIIVFAVRREDTQGCLLADIRPRTVPLTCWHSGGEVGWVQLPEARLSQGACPAPPPSPPPGVPSAHSSGRRLHVMAAGMRCRLGKADGRRGGSGSSAPSPGSQAATQRQRTALRGQGWIKIAWAGTARLPSQPGTVGTRGTALRGRHGGETHRPASCGEKPARGRGS